MQPPPGPQTFALPKKNGPVASPTTPTRQDGVARKESDDVDDLPPRMEHGGSPLKSAETTPRSGTPTPSSQKPANGVVAPSEDGETDEQEPVPRHAGFDLQAIKEALKEVEAGVAQTHLVSSSSTVNGGPGSVIGKGLSSSSSFVTPPPPRSQSTPPEGNPTLGFSSGTPSHVGGTMSLGASLGGWGQEIDYRQPSSSFIERGPKSADPTSSAFAIGGGLGRSVSEGWGAVGSGRGDGYRKSALSSLSFADDYDDDGDDEGDLSTARPSVGQASSSVTLSTTPVSLGLPEEVIPSWGSSSLSTGPTWGSSHLTSDLLKTTSSPYGLSGTTFSSSIEGTGRYGSMPEPFGLTFGGGDGDVDRSTRGRDTLDLSTGGGKPQTEWSIPPLGFGKKKGSEDNGLGNNPWS